MRGYVYLAGTHHHDLGIFKVGCSRHPYARMEQLWIPGKRSRPVVVAKWWVTDQRRAEWVVHGALGAYWVEGEWFRIGETEAREVIGRAIRGAIQDGEFPPAFRPRTLYNAVDRGDFPPRNAQPFTGGPKAKRRGK